MQQRHKTQRDSASARGHCVASAAAIRALTTGSLKASFDQAVNSVHDYILIPQQSNYL